jgi:heat shock protein HslJ
MKQNRQAALTGLLFASYLFGLPVAQAQTLPANPNPAPTAPTESNRLSGTTWELAFWEGSGAPNLIHRDTEVTAEFMGDRIAGSASCNRYTSTFSTEGDRFAVDAAIATTQMACTSRINRQEQMFLDALQNAETYEISHRGELEIIYQGPRGTGILIFQPTEQTMSLNGTAWTLDTWEGASAPDQFVPGTTMTAEFNGNGLSGSASCNRYMSQFALDGNQLTIGAIATTRMACQRDILQQENQFVAALEQTQSYRITPAGKLEIAYGTGSNAGVLTFTPRDFGSRPDVERVIYVDAQTASCWGVAPRQCLRIRENPSDPWMVLYTPIDGFDYEPGYSYRLRIAERTIANPPADGSSRQLVLLEVLEQTNASNPQPPTNPDRQAQLTASDPNTWITVRSQPTVQSSVVEYGRSGDTVTILEQTRGDDGYFWYKVQLANAAIQGWVRGDLVRVPGAAG